MRTFAEFATNHELHPHCCACGGCLLDPRIQQLEIPPLYWCVNCMERIDKAMPAGVARPWTGGFIFTHGAKIEAQASAENPSVTKPTNGETL